MGGFPLGGPGGASNKCEVGKTGHFLDLSFDVSRKRQEVRSKLLIMTNRKSHMLTPTSMTFDDLELI